MRPVLTKGCGDRLHHQDQHSNSQVIVAGEQYVHCLRRSAKQRRGRVHYDRGLFAFLDILAFYLTVKI